MEQNEVPTFLIKDDAVDLQRVSLCYRFYHCHFCRTAVKICRSCDRGNIFCSTCQEPQKSARIKKARNNYSKSPHGLKMRAIGAKRRRLKKQTDLNIEGDRGSPSCSDNSMTSSPAIPAVLFETGVTSHVQNSPEVSASQSVEVPSFRRDIPTVVCSKCQRPCFDFQKKSPGRLSAKEKQKIRAWQANLRDQIPRV
jgi:hypothetical protein